MKRVTIGRLLMATALLGILGTAIGAVGCGMGSDAQVGDEEGRNYPTADGSSPQNDAGGVRDTGATSEYAPLDSGPSPDFAVPEGWPSDTGAPGDFGPGLRCGAGRRPVGGVCVLPGEHQGCAAGSFSDPKGGGGCVPAGATCTPGYYAPAGATGCVSITRSCGKDEVFDGTGCRSTGPECPTGQARDQNAKCVAAGVPCPLSHFPSSAGCKTLNAGDTRDCGKDKYGTEGALPGAPVLYVDASAGGTTPDGSKARPFLTIGAALAKAQQGAIVRVAEGVYKENLTIARSVHIQGRCADKVKLEAAPAKPAVTITSGPNTIAGITISGGSNGLDASAGQTAVLHARIVSSAGDGIVSSGSCEVTLQRAVVSNHKGTGVRSMDTSQFGINLGIIETNGKVGVIHDSVVELKLTGTSVSSNGQEGLLLRRKGARATIEGCLFSGNGTMAVMADQGTSLVMRGSWVVQNRAGGISGRELVQGIIETNGMAVNGGPGVVASAGPSGSVAVRRNLIESSSGYGVLTLGGTVRIEGNTIKGTGVGLLSEAQSAGIGMRGKGSCTVNNNWVQGGKGYGLSSIGELFGIIETNGLIGNDRGGMLLRTPRGSRLKHNLVKENRGVGVLVARSANVSMEADLIIGTKKGARGPDSSGGHGLSTYVSLGMSLKHVYVIENAGHGFLLEISSGKAEGVLARKNGGRGMLFSRCSGMSVAGAVLDSNLGGGVKVASSVTSVLGVTVSHNPGSLGPGGGPIDSAFEVSGGGEVHLAQSHAQGKYKVGLRWREVAGIIETNGFVLPDEWGLAASIGAGQSLLVRGNVVLASAGGGGMHFTGGAQVFGNRVDIPSGGKPMAFGLVTRGNGLAVRGNRVRGAATAGILVNGGSAFGVAYNVVENSGGLGILAQSGATGEITANVVSISEEAGIAAISAGALRIEGNSVAETGTVGDGDGILVAGGSRSEVLGNSIIRSSRAGILFHRVDQGGVARNNDLEGNGYGIVSQASGPVVGISDNRFKGSSMGNMRTTSDASFKVNATERPVPKP